MKNAAVVAIILLVLVCSFLFTNADFASAINSGKREHYGAADEPHAGLNRASDLDSVPYGWASLQPVAGYRADSASAISAGMLRG